MAEATQTKPCAGTFCWNELMTRDVPRAKTFFTKMFGWTTEEMDMGPAGTYTIFKSGDQQVAGMMAMEGPQFEGVPEHWLAYIAVDDIAAATTKAESLGGMVIVPVQDISVGKFSIVKDPSGAVVGYFEGA